jgi:hypothetical protein
MEELTAKQAAELSARVNIEGQKYQVSKILDEVRKEAKIGGYSITTSEISAPIREYLKELGYEIEDHSSYGDDPWGESGFFIIKW